MVKTFIASAGDIILLFRILLQKLFKMIFINSSSDNDLISSSDNPRVKLEVTLPALTQNRTLYLKDNQSSNLANELKLLLNIWLGLQTDKLITFMEGATGGWS